MIIYKNTRSEAFNKILLYSSAIIFMVAYGSPDGNSVLNKCQNMEDCPAGEICENYDRVKYPFDYMVEAEILLG